MKASRPEFTVKKTPCIVLGFLSDEYFIILGYFKPEKLKYNFSNNQLLSIASEVRFYYFLTAIYTHLLFTAKRFRSKQNITQDNYALI